MFALIAALLTISGCEQHDPYAAPLALSAPSAVAGGLVFHDAAASRLLTLRPADKANAAPAVRPMLYDGDPDVRALTPDAQRLVLLDIGAKTLAMAEPGKPHKDKDTGEHAARTWQLPAEFTSLLLSSDSQTCVVFHGGSGGGNSLVNTAEVGLVDLNKDGNLPETDKGGADANPRVATITGLSRKPLKAHVSGEIAAADGAHRVVWIDATSMIGVADFAPGGKTRTMVIPLVAGVGKGAITPLGTVAREGQGKLELYVIAIGSNDVLHITINLDSPKLGATLDQINSGAGPASIHVYDGKDGTRVLTTNADSRDLAVLDPTTGTGTYVHLDVLTTQVVPYVSETGAQMAMLWSPQLQDFHLVALDKVPTKKGKAVQRVHIDQPILGVTAASDRFLLRHPSSDRGLSLYDARFGKQTVFAGTGGIIQELRVGEAFYALGLLGGHTRLSRIDLSDLHGHSITLQHRAAERIYPFSGGIVAAGPGLGGWWLAVFSGGKLVANEGAWLEAFALQGVL